MSNSTSDKMANAKTNDLGHKLGQTNNSRHKLGPRKCFKSQLRVTQTDMPIKF